mmetsp:Transcript_30303/g.42963  ORF Transcript_30303/g.42963 Transcript_30303/m.42963 type:complete len:81 (-) Transcript_30303:1849-2091(-)
MIQQQKLSARKMGVKSRYSLVLKKEGAGRHGWGDKEKRTNVYVYICTVCAICVLCLIPPWMGFCTKYPPSHSLLVYSYDG